MEKSKIRQLIDEMYDIAGQPEQEARFRLKLLNVLYMIEKELERLREAGVL